VEGIPLSSLDGSWKRASPVSHALFPAGWRDDIIVPSDSDFVCQGDFNNDGRPDKAVAGVFQSRAGPLGYFLLILTESSADHWRVAFLKSHETNHNFNAVECRSQRVTWSFCLECDISLYVEWDGTQYRVTEPPEPR
jgi:hypothetical protein